MDYTPMQSIEENQRKGRKESRKIKRGRGKKKYRRFTIADSVEKYS
jgi:hypothetical protein